jgi:hypothetical protein
MLEIFLIASGSFLVAMFCVWLLRGLRSWREAQYRTVQRSGKGRPLKAGHGRGTVELKLDDSRIGAGARSGSRKPWGW